MPVQLVITMDEKGNVNVNGPLANRVLCFGLLEMAKSNINEWVAKQQEQRVQPASDAEVAALIKPGN